ncbi:hypothetical protein ACFP1Z_07480 [Streptomyces gamaensis]|uniref:Uncharacterized protein n=1 Tax=Streptomyces gamaensis TaxID=1763542 RepID=A0ABW0YTZ5_9ACTN
MVNVWADGIPEQQELRSCDECRRIYDGYCEAARQGDGEAGWKWTVERFRHYWRAHA